MRGFSFFNDENPAWYTIFTDKCLYHIYYNGNSWEIDEWKEVNCFDNASKRMPKLKREH